MSETHSEARFLFFVSSERRDKDCTTTTALLNFKTPLNLTIYDTATTSQEDTSQHISALFSPVSDGFDHENNTIFPDITLRMEQNFKHLQELLQNEEENGAVTQLEISQNEMLDFLFANDDSIENLDEKPPTATAADLRVKIIKQFTELYGNLSPCVMIEKSTYKSAVTKRNKKGLRRIPRRNYARMNTGGEDSCGSSNDDESSIVAYNGRKMFSTIKKNKNNPCPVCMLYLNTPRELHDHRLVCKAVNNRCKNKNKNNRALLTTTKQEPNRYSCPYCPFSYRDKMILANHKQYHALPKGGIHYCGVCGMTFRKPEMAQRHRKIHFN